MQGIKNILILVILYCFYSNSITIVILYMYLIPLSSLLAQLVLVSQQRQLIQP